jgi:hypothetical protein
MEETTMNSAAPNTDLQAALTSLERAKSTKLAEVEEIEKAIQQLNGLILVVAPGTMPKNREFQGMGITEATLRFLDEVGTPQDTRSIADALTDRGLQTRSKNFLATVYATLKNSKKVRRSGEYWELVR